jgi:hypothetical protein
MDQVPGETAVPMAGAPAAQPASTLTRLASGVAGSGILLVSALFTLGASLAAPFGVRAARRLARRRSRPLSRWGSWVGAVLASSLAVALWLTTYVTLISPESLQQVRRATAAGSSARQPPPPAWFSRAFPVPRPDPDAPAERLIHSTWFADYVLLFTALVLCLFSGTLAGSLGWAGTVLLGHALTGHF